MDKKKKQNTKERFTYSSDTGLKVIKSETKDKSKEKDEK